MTETLTAGRKGGGRNHQDSAATGDAVSVWFIREILPLETNLMRYLRRNWHNASDIADLRQEVYARVFDAARERIPDEPARFLAVTARNLLINLVRREQVVSIEAVSDLDSMEIAAEAPGPDRVVAARDELRHVQAALDRLPPRTKAAVVLTYVEELKVREIAKRMGVAKSTVSAHLTSGLRALADMLHEPGERGEKS